MLSTTTKRMAAQDLMRVAHHYGLVLVGIIADQNDTDDQPLVVFHNCGNQDEDELDLLDCAQGELERFAINIQETATKLLEETKAD